MQISVTALLEYLDASHTIDRRHYNALHVFNENTMLHENYKSSKKILNANHPQKFTHL